jgi:hypothetical protein
MSTATLQRSYVFLSYSRSEGVVAKRLEQDLRVHGFQVWRDVSSIDPGSPDWEEAVREGISHAYAVVLIASPSVIQSHYIKGELSLAKLNLPNRIYPVWVDGTDWPDCVPIDFINTEYIDMRGEQYEEGFKVLVKMLQKAKEQPSPPPPDIEPPPPPLRRFPKRLVLIVGLVLLLIILIISSGIVYNTTIFQPNQRHLQATATAQANATATASVTNPYYQNGTLVINDPLSSQGNWAEGSNAYGSSKFEGEEYHVQTFINDGYEYWEGPFFSNFVFEVQMTFIKGDGGGVKFRGDTNKSTDYEFLINQNGTYGIWREDSSTSYKTFVDFLPNSAINHGLGKTNTLAIVANGDTMTFYVNHVQVNRITDSTYSQGEIALVANSEGNLTEVAFRNAKVWTM